MLLSILKVFPLSYCFLLPVCFFIRAVLTNTCDFLDFVNITSIERFCFAASSDIIKDDSLILAHLLFLFAEDAAVRDLIIFSQTSQIVISLYSLCFFEINQQSNIDRNYYSV